MLTSLNHALTIIKATLAETGSEAIRDIAVKFVRLEHSMLCDERVARLNYEKGFYLRRLVSHRNDIYRGESKVTGFRAIVRAYAMQIASTDDALKKEIIRELGTAVIREEFKGREARMKRLLDKQASDYMMEIDTWPNGQSSISELEIEPLDLAESDRQMTRRSPLD